MQGPEEPIEALAPFRLRWSIKSPPFVTAAMVLTLVATVWPDQELPLRLATPFIALVVVIAPYLFFRAYLSAVAARGLSWSYYYTVVIYYMGIIGAALSLLLIPLEWNQLAVAEIPKSLVLLSGPSSLSAAIAATEVADKNE